MVADSAIFDWVEETLYQMSQAQQEAQTACQHCGLPFRYPLIARRSDIEEFLAIFQSMQNIADRHGITANLLAEIRAECIVEKMKRVTS